MYLKSIEVQGFKSFANKINFKFHNGITGIVGPNGSGKSNVADAVRWVLGEQRIKQLRGASMQDVIFSGTENRKPLGYAYVAITMDNSDHQISLDYEEVTVARRIYRSGESEYLLNGTPCRLKDVSELFYDTGVGKEGYSIIGQGQIDKILSGKPEERRELFDEAAGIVKFKKRKQTAQKKLEDEKLNLVRVSDILSELEKQVAPLEKQAAAAKVYLKKKEELKTLDVNMFLLENNRIKDQLLSVEQKYKIAKDDFTSSHEEYERIKEEYEQIQAELEQLDTTIEQARATLSDTGQMRGRLESEIAVLKEQIRSAEGNREHLQVRVNTVQGEIDNKNQEKHVFAEEKKAVDEQFEQVRTVRDEAKGLLSEVQSQITNLNRLIEQGKNEIMDTLNERATIKSKIGRIDTMLEQAAIRKAELNSRLLRAKSDESEQDETIKQLQTEFEKVNKEIVLLNEKQQTMEERLGQIHTELSQEDAKLRDTQVLYHQDKSKLDAITNLTERYDGYGNSIKKVMEQKENTPGIAGVVADIIKVDKKYETAIEIALGGNIQNIVTKDEETAKKMIRFLKENKFGRATFLPLTSITKPQAFKTPEVLQEKGVIGLADSLVRVENSYSNVAKAMLGRIVVVDTIDSAVAIARKYDYGIRMVTIEGELFVPGGAISGGAFKNSSNLLGRRREMEELEGKVKQHLRQVDAILEKIEQIKEERNKLRIEIEDTKTNLQEQFIAQNTIRLNVIKAQERKTETTKGFGTLQEEQSEIDTQVIELTENKTQITIELQESAALEGELTSAIEKYQQELEEKRKAETEQTGKVSELEVEVEKMLQKEEFQQQNVERIDGELLRFTQELKEIKDSLSATKLNQAEKEENILEIEKTIAASHTAQGESEIQLKESITQKEKLNTKQKNFFQTREDMAERITALDKEVLRLQAQQERLEESISTQINYMWNEYEITLSDAALMRDESMTDLVTM
ncbi:MAG: chromosome segregation protein SMC, partial [Lachnospiraceae bacterium]